MSWSVAWHTLAFTKNNWAAYDCVLLVVMLVIVLMRLHVVTNTNFKETSKSSSPRPTIPLIKYLQLNVQMSILTFSTSFETCFQLFIGLVSREVIFQELSQDENCNEPVEASIFY